MEKISRQRRSESAWREIVERHGQSGLTVPEFCEREGIKSASLYGWRSRLSEGSQSPPVSRPVAKEAKPSVGPPSGFIDLGPLGSSGSRFEVRLELGGGVLLHLVRLMFFPEGQIRVRLYGEPCDMRKSFNGLTALVSHGLGCDPLDGTLYAFVSRRATQMRVLYFDRSGFCIWAKRLEAGRFIADWSQVRIREMDWTTLKLLLEGIEPRKWRKRYRLAQEKNDSTNTVPSV